MATLGLVDAHVVEQAEVDDVDAEFGVDDVAHRLVDVVARGHGRGGVNVGHRFASACQPASATALFIAIQPSRAHFTRAGYFDTPSNAIASSSSSSSSSVRSALPCDCIRS